MAMLHTAALAVTSRVRHYSVPCSAAAGERREASRHSYMLQETGKEIMDQVANADHEMWQQYTCCI